MPRLPVVGVEPVCGIAAGLVFHFARDIAESPPGVRMLLPLQPTAWTASYWWSLGMIIALTAVRLILASAGIPSGRRLHRVQLLMTRLAMMPGSRITASGRERPDRDRRRSRPLVP